MARVVRVAGISFRAAAIAAATREGVHSAALVPEPDNPHDGRAVKVVLNGVHHVGYLPRGCAWDARAARVCHVGPTAVWLAA